MRNYIVLSFTFFSITLAAQFTPIQRSDMYQVYLDLNEVTDDKLPVQMVTPIVNQDSVEFHIPRIIPGTYDVHNYGRFVNDFTALSGGGDTLRTRKIDLNRWMIYDARDLYKITYKADDTYDAENADDIFQPAGTSLEDSVFLLNNFGFVGYLKPFQDVPFELQVEKPRGFYGSTALQGKIGDTLDVYEIEDYFTLHDNPLMYNVPDTATRMVGNTEVLVSVYTPNNTVSAAESMERISAVLDAAADYLGGKLPAEKYAVLIYTVPMDQAGTSYGALEHHTSTVLYMPEFQGEQFYSGVQDITSHEFFHIITPLRIHSQMVSDFDFINPEMSRHIWLYEGVTEYNSHLVQVLDSIYSMEKFLDVIRDKMKTADKYNKDIPLTVASEHTLTFLKDQYYDFYQKGALAGMALDLKLMELSEGEYRLIDLLTELGQTYGTDTFFVDDELFNIITEMTYPEMREFFARHYEGAEPFPFEELLEQVGIEYKPEVAAKRLSIGNIDLSYNFSTKRLKVESIEDIDAFGRDLGWQVGDEIMEINGTELTLNNMSDVIDEFYANTEPGDKVKILVARPVGEGEYDEEKLKAEARLVDYMVPHYLRPVENPTSEQLRMRRIWINQ